jgi:dihydroorotase-like cyclic amidohydrolase
MSAAGAIDLIARAKDQGLRITAETCPHYLMFTDDALARWGPYAKCNPPLRPQETQDRLWEALSSGVIDVLGTDHSPYLDDEKAPYVDNIWDARAGVPGLEEFVPLMLTAVQRGRLSLPRVVHLMGENPARLFGLWPRKGTLAVGADADVIIVDPRAEWVHDHRTLYTKSRDTALMYDGLRFHGRLVMTIARGRVVMEDGRVVGDPGWGREVVPG